MNDKKPTQPKPENHLELFTASRLSRLSQLPREQVEKRLVNAPAEMQGKRRLYRLENALPLLCQGQGHAAHRSEDRARREKAEADSAEMDAAKKAGTLMLTADARRFWADGFAQVRRVIETSGLSATQKRTISAKLFAIRLDDDAIPSAAPMPTQ